MHTQLRSRYGVLIDEEPHIWRGRDETLYVGGYWRDSQGIAIYANPVASTVMVEVTS